MKERVRTEKKREEMDRQGEDETMGQSKKERQ